MSAKLDPNEQVVMITDDHIIQSILIDAGLTVCEPPKPPNDTATAFFTHDGWRWIVTRFFKKGDEGYVAFGVRDTAPREVLLDVCKVWADGMEAQAAANGRSAFENAEFHPAGRPKDI